MGQLQQPASTELLVGTETSDDAGVYRLNDREAIVVTADFITPPSDDPRLYGQIAAANSLSDVYAMGGRPLTALAIAGFPKEALDRDTIRRIFEGGLDKLREAGVALLGGHTVQDPEIKFGYAVTGAIDPARVLTNAGARAGDILFLTKPIGTGVIGTALKFDRVDETFAREAIESMRTLNRAAADAIQQLSVEAVHACTDITGFGLIGHASELAAASNVTVRLHASRVPVFAGAREIALRNRSGGLGSNEDHFEGAVRVAGVDEAMVSLLYDPQTSGGLLIAAAAAHADAVERALVAAGVLAARVGEVEPLSAATRLIVVA